MSFDVSIRRASEDDAEAIVAVLNPIIEAGRYTGIAEPVSVDDQLAFIRSLPERSIYSVAIADRSGAIVGIQDVLPTAGNATSNVGAISTFVSLASHGHGIGRALSNVTFEAARQAGYRTLTATIRADNPSAVAFYRRIGFEIIGTAPRHTCVNGSYIAAILAEKLL